MSAVITVRKKPVVHQAMRYDGGPLSWSEVHDFIGAKLFPYMVNPSKNTLRIFTLHGHADVEPGDWILKESDDNVWPCKPEVFERYYEVLHEPTHT